MWTYLELRVPIPAAAGRPFVPTHFRSFTDFRFAGRHDGLSAAFWRVGPIWDLHPNFWLAVHAVGAALATAPEALTGQYRVELEPNLRLRAGPVVLWDRNRLEARWQGDRRWGVYRNQARVNVLLNDWLAPFVSEELFVDLGRSQFDQNRLQVGVGILMAGLLTRIDVGYQLRSRLSASRWHHDHCALLGLAWLHAWGAP